MVTPPSLPNYEANTSAGDCASISSRPPRADRFGSGPADRDVDRVIVLDAGGRPDGNVVRAGREVRHLGADEVRHASDRLAFADRAVPLVADLEDELAAGGLVLDVGAQV